MNVLKSGLKACSTLQKVYSSEEYKIEFIKEEDLLGQSVTIEKGKTVINGLFYILYIQLFT